MRRGRFVPVKWRFPERHRSNLPVELILKRLAAPRFVFNFIFLFFFTISSLPKISSGLSASRRLTRPRRSGRCRALFRSQPRQQDVGFHPGPEFHLGVVHNGFQQAVLFSATHILVRHFAAAMKNHRLHFVTFAKEPDDLVLSHLIIVLGGGRPEFHFLDVRTLLALFLFVGFFILLVEKLAVVHDFADGRDGVRRNFHHVQARFTGFFHRVEEGHYSELIPLFVNHADFASADALFYFKSAARSTPFCDKTTSRACSVFFAARIPTLRQTESSAWRHGPESIARLLGGAARG